MNIDALLRDKDGQFLKHLKCGLCLEELSLREFMKVFIPTGLQKLLPTQNIETSITYTRMGQIHRNYVDLIYISVKAVSNIVVSDVKHANKLKDILLMEEKRLLFFNLTHWTMR